MGRLNAHPAGIERFVLRRAVRTVAHRIKEFNDIALDPNREWDVHFVSHGSGDSRRKRSLPVACRAIKEQRLAGVYCRANFIDDLLVKDKILKCMFDRGLRDHHIPHALGCTDYTLGTVSGTGAGPSYILRSKATRARILAFFGQHVHIVALAVARRSPIHVSVMQTAQLIEIAEDDAETEAQACPRSSGRSVDLR